MLPDTLVSKRLFRDPLVAVLREDHPAMAKLGKNLKLRTEWLAQDPFVLFDRSAGAGIRDQVIALRRSAGFTPRVVQDAREASTIIGSSQPGSAYPFCPRRASTSA